MKITTRQRREARRLYRVCLVDGLLDEGRVRLVVRRVAAAGRRGRVAILSHFARLVKLDRALHEAVVESAAPLPADLSARFAAGVRRQYGAGTDIAFVDTPALIGGVRVKVGSDVYDGSVRGALTRLERRF